MAAGLSLPDLVAELRSPDPEKRRAAVVEIARRNDPGLLAHVEPLTADPDASVRYYAKKAAASLASGLKADADRPATRGAGLPERARARIEAIQSAVEAGRRDELPLFLAQLAVEEDRYVRATLLKAVGRLGAAEHAAQVVPFLKDPDPRVVANAVEALGMLRDEGSQLAMLDLLSHPDTRVKGNLAKALWNYSGGDTVGAQLLLERLRGMLESAKPWDRESAVHVLGQIGTREAAELLKGALEDSEEHIRRQASELLARLDTARPASPEPGPAAKRAAPPAMPAVHVEAEWRALMADGGGGALARLAARIYDPARPARDNLVAVSAALCAALALLFGLLVAVNVLQILASSDPAGGPAARGGAADRTGEAERLAAAGAHERVFAMLAASAALTPGERDALDRSASALFAARDRAGDGRGLADLLAAWEAAHPDSAVLASRRGDHALKWRGDPVRAAEAYRIALKRRPEYPDALLGLGDALLSAGKPAEALPLYERAAALAPGSGRAEFSAGNALAHLKRFAEAEARFRRAVAVNPLDPLARLGLGKTLAALGRSNDAARELATAAELDPSLVLARLELARLLRESDPARALNELRRAVEADPDSLEALRAYARLLFDLRMWRPAAAALSKLAERVPGEAQVYGELGAALLGDERPGAAKDALERAVALDPACGVANYHLALLAEANGDPAGAERRYKAALEAGYEPRATLLTLSSLCLAANRNEEALAWADRGLERFPADLAMRYNRGAALVALGRNEEAKPLFLALAAELRDADADLAARVKYYMGLLGAKPPDPPGGPETR